MRVIASSSLLLGINVASSSFLTYAAASSSLLAPLPHTMSLHQSPIMVRCGRVLSFFSQPIRIWHGQVTWGQHCPWVPNMQHCLLLLAPLSSSHGRCSSPVLLSCIRARDGGATEPEAAEEDVEWVDLKAVVVPASSSYYLSCVWSLSRQSSRWAAAIVCRGHRRGERRGEWRARTSKYGAHCRHMFDEVYSAMWDHGHVRRNIQKNTLKCSRGG